MGCKGERAMQGLSCQLRRYLDWRTEGSWAFIIISFKHCGGVRGIFVQITVGWKVWRTSYFLCRGNVDNFNA